MQKGMLMKDSVPKPDDMTNMSEHLAKLESYPDLDVNIMRETKINKVLKAIIKLEDIPREDEFNFKQRSMALLEKWNKLLAADDVAPASNGINGKGSGDKVSVDTETKTATSSAETGVKEHAEAEPAMAEV